MNTYILKLYIKIIYDAKMTKSLYAKLKVQCAV